MANAPDVKSRAVKGHLQRIRELARTPARQPVVERRCSQPRSEHMPPKPSSGWRRPRAGEAEKDKEADGAGPRIKEGRGKDAKSQRDPRQARRAHLHVIHRRDPARRCSQVHQAGDHDQDIRGHPDLCRSRRPARSGEVHDVDREEHGSRGRAAAPNLATAAETARPDLLRRGWNPLYHIGGVRRHFGVRTGDA